MEKEMKKKMSKRGRRMELGTKKTVEEPG